MLKQNWKTIYIAQNWKTIYSRTTIKSVPLLEPEHGFCQQNGPERMAKYWYPNEKMVVVPVCLNGRCSYSGCEGVVSY